MKRVGIMLVAVLFAAWISGAGWCCGATPQPPRQAAPHVSMTAQAGDDNATTEPCEKSRDFKPISRLIPNIAPSAGELPQDCHLRSAAYQGRAFSPFTYCWTASGLCHKPLYFEEEQLERYGNTSCASIPLCLAEAEQTGRLKDGDHLLLAGFGAGLSWGTCVTTWRAR